MKGYTVTVRATVERELYIEAESKEEAEALAEEDLAADVRAGCDDYELESAAEEEVADDGSDAYDDIYGIPGYGAY